MVLTRDGINMFSIEVKSKPLKYLRLLGNVILLIFFESKIKNFQNEINYLIEEEIKL